MTDKPLHYLDSGVFSAFLNGAAEPTIFDECNAIIRAAEEGSIRALTSAFTMGEVVYIKTVPDKKPLTIEQQEDLISSLLNSHWLERVSFEPDMAEINRYLLREYGGGKKDLKPYDSVHLATAIRMKADYFNTIDDNLIQRLPTAINCPPRYPKPVLIQRPFVIGQQMSMLDL
jgi:predicted nucleic acid-binding protein